MAIQVEVPLRPARDLDLLKRKFRAESVSWNSKPGQNVSVRPSSGVPEGKLWILQSIYVHNGEDDIVSATLFASDGETDHIRFGASETPMELLPHAELTWTGQLLIPNGWQVGVRLANMGGTGAQCHWRYSAIEF